MKKEEINHFLIKRSNSIREIRKNNIRRKGFFELTIRKTAFKPPSAEIKPNDIVYVAETSGGIYAMGDVIESGQVETFTSIEKLLEYSQRFNDDLYWLPKIREFSRKLSSNKNSISSLSKCGRVFL